MAYIAFSDNGATTGPAPIMPVADPVPPRDDRLSGLEWSVVAIARKDGRASLRRPGRLSTALRVVFRQSNPQLADERLEALRRMAVLLWRDGDAVPAREVDAFLAAGFTPGQHDTLSRSIGAARATSAATRRDSGRTGGGRHV